MRITGLFLNNEIRTGGNKRYLELMEALSSKGHQVTLFVNDHLDWHPVFCNEIRIPLEYDKKRRVIPLSVLFFLAIKKHVRSNKNLLLTDWLIIFGETHWKAARWFSAYSKAPILFAFRSDLIAENNAYRKFYPVTIQQQVLFFIENAKQWLEEREILSRCHTVVFQSSFDLTSFSDRHPSLNIPSKSSIIPGDILQPRFKPEFALSNTSHECRKILFVGTLGKRKGLSVLLNALSLLVERGIRDISLDIIAAGTDWEYFRQIAVSLDITKYVHYHGKSDNPLNWMKQSDLLIVPSLFDSYPNTILEALHVGLPVLASTTGGIPDMLEDATLLFPPGDATILADKIYALYSSEKEYAVIHRLCTEKRSRFCFDWAGKFENILLPKNSIDSDSSQISQSKETKK